ncbi:unnamed protein product [Amoebophrya sp. A120]|nr:unnamed protein product [Amoebophrya sp. A120]|eukprot:GSA120T00010056001.1
MHHFNILDPDTILAMHTGLLETEDPATNKIAPAEDAAVAAAAPTTTTRKRNLKFLERVAPQEKKTAEKAEAEGQENEGSQSQEQPAKPAKTTERKFLAPRGEE